MNPSRPNRFIAVLLCAAFVFPLFPVETPAQNDPQIIKIEIGQPAVWSLGQAHYLLARMHQRNRHLETLMPDKNALDPNKIAAARIDALRQSLGIEAQFDQSMKVRNEIAQRNFRESETNREQARVELRTKQAELQQTNSELSEINEKLAVLRVEDQQSSDARDRSTPPAPPTAEDNERQKQIAVLEVRKRRKEEERDALKAEITSLTTRVNTAPTAPTFESPTLSTAGPSLPSSETFQKFMDKALAEAGKPDLSASMKLDNFVQMQYEIIAKQLTLLRDEVGPDDRVIFLELPASIYTVDKKADGYVAQVEWEIKRICDREPPPHIQEEVIREILEKEGREEEADAMLLRINKVRDVVIEKRAGARHKEQQDQKRDLNYFIREERDRVGRLRPVPYPITLEMIKRYKASAGEACTKASTENVRAIDIIPRQSALNVNEYHATIKQTMIMAAFKFLIGFAGKVNFQRQREMYEQFVQQQIFASGYGKGRDKFGWTFGPQPGTNRIAPGQRTTFAVLVVPRNTLAIELKARGRHYKRNKSPDSEEAVQSDEETYFLSVPGKRTQEFWVDSINYVPVRKGRRVTVVIEGNYFSPQLGIMVNGVPLEPALSITRIAGASAEETDVQSGDGIAGEYEVTSSRQIVLSFTLGDSYVGTPTITFTSPEKSTPINFFNIDINHRGHMPLQEHSIREPMFLDDFVEKQEIEVIRDVPVFDNAGNMLDRAGNTTLDPKMQRKFKLVRLKGSGLRPNADITLNNEPISSFRFGSLQDILRNVTQLPTPTTPFVAQDSTKSYILYFDDPRKEKWKIAYRHLTRQGYEEGSAAKDFSTPSFVTTLRNYRFNAGGRRSEIDLTFTSTKAITAAKLDDPSGGGRCLDLKRGGDDEYRVKCFVPADNRGQLERDFITIRVNFADDTHRYEDIRLPVRPQLFSIMNPRTGRAEGFADEEPTLVISGRNLQGVTSVLFGGVEAKVNGVTSDSIAVKVPKAAGVSKGQVASVPIILQTAGGRFPSGAIYTYIGEPLAPVFLWPPFGNGKN